MQADSQLIRQNLKWTFRLFRFGQAGYFVMGILCLIVAFAKPSSSAVLLCVIAGICLAITYWIQRVIHGLLKGSESAWKQAVAISGLFLASLTFPLAIASLVQLLKVDRGSLNPRPDSKLRDEYQPLPSEERNWIVPIVSALAILAILICYFMTTTHDGEVVQGLSKQQLYDKGANCNTSGDTKCSVAVFTRLLEINPADQTARANLAMEQTQAGLHQESIKNYELYIQHGGQALDTLAYYAQSLNALGNKDRALEWYMKVLNLNPHLVDIAQDVTSILIDQGKPAQARMFLDGFIKQNPKARPYFMIMQDRLKRTVSQARTTSI